MIRNPFGGYHNNETQLIMTNKHNKRLITVNNAQLAPAGLPKRKTSFRRGALLTNWTTDRFKAHVIFKLKSQNYIHHYELQSTNQYENVK